MRSRFLLFTVSCLVGGAAALAGSMIGAAVGKVGLAGGILGGVIGAMVSTAVARRCHWIRPKATRSTAVATAIGFLAAAAVAMHTLGSPVGPILSTGLIGVGALVGAAVGRRD